jgi:Na+/melibiose symporter-like transporter
LWCMAFLSVFLPWSEWITGSSSAALTGIQFIIGLCLYDAMLSYVLLAHSSLLADIAINTEQRAVCNMFNSIFAAIGSNSVFVSHLYWDKSDLIPFWYFIHSIL